MVTWSFNWLTKEFELIASVEKQLTIEEAEEFYKEHRGKFFYPRLVSFMTVHFTMRK